MNCLMTAWHEHEAHATPAANNWEDALWLY